MNRIAETLFMTSALLVSVVIIIALLVSMDERKKFNRAMAKLDRENESR
jgi:hypothetical protein